MLEKVLVTLVVFVGFEIVLRVVPGPSAIQYCTMLRFNAVLLIASAVGTTDGQYPIQYKTGHIYLHYGVLFIIIPQTYGLVSFLLKLLEGGCSVL
jgi:hypothetical protein